MMFLRRRRKREELDARVAAARAEAETSRRRLSHAREHVIKPLNRRADQNHFADLVRASLREEQGTG